MCAKYYKSIKTYSCLMQSKLIVFIIFIIISFNINNSITAQNQRAFDLGVMLGASYYMGDMNLYKHLYSPHLNIGGIIKYHYNPRYILRIGAFHSRLSAYDKDFQNAFQQQRNHGFATSLIELSTQVEFNFFPFIIGQQQKQKFIPYLQTGLVLYFANESEDFLSFALPIGIGIKKNITPRLIVGAEWAFRRSFSDMLDNITGKDISSYSTSYSTPIDDDNQHKQRAFIYTNDWYAYLAVTLSYGFKFGGLGCPAYYNVY